MANGSWEIVATRGFYGQPRYVGKLVVNEPMAFLCKVYDASGYSYVKTPKNDRLEHEFECFLHSLRNARVQPIFCLGPEYNRESVSEIKWAEDACVFSERGAFEEGRPFAIAHFRAGGPAIELLGLSCPKLKSLRNKIWRVKERFLESVDEPNKGILLRTRRGYVKST